MKKHYRKEDNCLNCNATLQGKFCHVCGQENLQIKESFGHVMNHAISDYFHFDHQFFNTLKPLLLQPGKLTLEYMAGRRMQYLHPIKMYIFISLIFFLLLFRSHDGPNVTKTTTGNPAKNELIKTSKDLEEAINDPKVPSYTKTIIKQTKKAIQAELIDSTKRQTQKAESIKKSDDESSKSDNAINGRLPGASEEENYETYLVKQQKMPGTERDGFLVRMYKKKAFVYQEKYGKKAKEAFFDDVKHNIPKMMFLLLPLCALIFKVAFWNNNKFYVEHLIFTFHLHCFVFLFFTILRIIQMVTPEMWHINSWLNLLRFIGVTWYLYRSLRVFYQRSRWRTISKMIGAGLMYGIAFIFCFIILALITTIF